VGGCLGGREKGEGEEERTEETDAPVFEHLHVVATDARAAKARARARREKSFIFAGRGLVAYQDGRRRRAIPRFLC